MRDVIIALDFSNAKMTLDFLDKFSNVKPFVKIGMELFYAEGPSIVKTIKERGHKIFLDLKLHDIPNTVKGAMRSVSNLGVDIVNVHAAGGIEMMKAALEGATQDNGSRPLIVAITQLTSISQIVMQDELWIGRDINETILHYAKNTKEAGLDGVVCSPLEAGFIKKELGNNFITITPGVRFLDEDSGDQVRITTPAKAKETGTDYIVVGRPITKAKYPVDAYNRCKIEFMGA